MSDDCAFGVLEAWDFAHEVVGKIRLPPGLRVWLSSKYDFPDVVMHVEGLWPDVNDTSRKTTTYKTINLFYDLQAMAIAGRPEHEIAAMIVRRVQSTAQAMWMHEFDEWVQYDGKHVRDPHPGGRLWF